MPKFLSILIVANYVKSAVKIYSNRAKHTEGVQFGICLIVHLTDIRDYRLVSMAYVDGC